MTDVLAVIETYTARLSRQHAPADDPDVARLVSALRDRYGQQIVGILLYGSYLRGARDTLLDFYVVVDSYADSLDSRLGAIAGWLLPPNVYYLTVGEAEDRLRAKYALVTLAQLQRQAVAAIHPYFWARLTQPCSVLFVRNRESKRRLLRVFEQSVRTFVKRVAPMLEDACSPQQFWSRGFSLTYNAELRADASARVETLFEHHAGYYTLLLSRLADGQHLIVGSDGRYLAVSASRQQAKLGWALVIALGKVLSLARLMKGAITFEDPVDYILWKIERHSGIKAEATQRQRRYPLLFAWPLVWRLYRQGAFR
ncbi:MAG: hypothetical protein O7B25_16005 [Gammaproteobacteria bacterium]|nr:hypothetical protein [Gammaproteobacteria bacterium]